MLLLCSAIVDVDASIAILIFSANFSCIDLIFTRTFSQTYYANVIHSVLHVSKGRGGKRIHLTR